MFFAIFLDKQQRTSTSTLICWVFVWIQGSLAKTTPFSNKVLQRFCIETTQVFLEEKKSTLNFQPPRLWYFFGTPKTQQFVSLWRLCQWPAQPFCLKRLGTKYSNFRVSAAGVEISTPETRAVQRPFFSVHIFHPWPTYPKERARKQRPHAPAGTLAKAGHVLCHPFTQPWKESPRVARRPKYYPPTSSHLPPLAGKKWLEVFWQSNQNLMRWKNELFWSCNFWWASLYVRDNYIDYIPAYIRLCVYIYILM